MLPPIKYKVHPKILQIQQQKRKRRQILEQARQKQANERQQLKQGRQQYIKNNKQVIQNKLQGIYERKLAQRNRIREQDLGRAQRIANKKTELLMKIIPQRRQLINNIRQQYLDSLQKNDKAKQERVRKMVEEKLEEENKKFRQTFTKEQKIRNNNIIDTNDGICVLCLVTQAQIYMKACKHLIACSDCQFMLRMNKKCPLCRAPSKYESLSKNSMKSRTKSSFKAKN